MKFNRILASAVVLALGCSGTAMATHDAAECSSEAARLTTDVGKSTLTATAKADLTKALTEAKSADLARCEQVVSRARREIGVGPEVADTDPSSANRPAPTSESAGYEDGHASANESLPKHPGAAANDSSSASVSASGEAEEGYASANETMKGDTKPAVSEHVHVTPVTPGTTDYASASADSRDASEASTSDDYEDGHASAAESLPQHPGATENDSRDAGISATGEMEQGYASPTATLKSKTVPARADTGSNALASKSTKDLIDKPVMSPEGKQLGEVEAIVRDKTADAHGYAVISFGGVLGVGEKQALVGIDQLKVAKDGSLQLPASDPKDFAAYPEYVEKNYTKYDGSIAQIL